MFAKYSVRFFKRNWYDDQINETLHSDDEHSKFMRLGSIDKHNRGASPHGKQSYSRANI
jgi:hypothetical protein